MTAPQPGTLSSPRAWITLLAVLVLGTAADLWTKHAAFEHIADQPVTVIRDEVLESDNLSQLIPRHEPIEVIPSVLDLTLVLNPGAVFGLGAGKRWLFIAFMLGAVVMGLAMFARWTSPRDWLAHASLGLLLSGGIGNLYDRLQFACVRDFIHPLPGVTVAGREIWPYVSNVADALLIIGIAGLMWHLWRADDPNAARKIDAGHAADTPSDSAG